MLSALVHFSLKFRGIVIALACIGLAYGIYILGHAKLDVFPNFVQPQVEIQTECPGLTPDQVESLATLPIEAMVNGLGEMESLRSESIPGLSVVTALFKEGTDVFRARQMLAEKLAETAGQLPVGIKSPKMSPLTSSTMDLLKIGLVSEKLSPMELRAFADWTLKARLLSVPGVAKCSIFGGDVRQLQIQVLPERLGAYDLALSDVLAVARVATGVMGAGFVENENQRIAIQTEGQALTPRQLGEVVISNTNGFSVRLKDIARVVEGPEPKFGGALIQGEPGVLMTLSSQYGANTLDVTRSLEAALAEMRSVFDSEGIKLYPRLHRPATFIENALRNVGSSLALGGVLVAVVLFCLLGSVRTACISLTAIPVSLLTALIILDRFGVSINTMTLGGLAIALGEVVDDSIIDVENIIRRLRENRRLGQTRPIFQVVFQASLEVRRAVVYATFIVALIFLPVLTLTGLQGSFFAPLGLSYILAILSSLLVALTLTPALALTLFRSGVSRDTEPWLQWTLKAGYTRLLHWVERWPRVLIAFVVVVSILALARLPSREGQFLPDFREGHYVLQITAAPGTSLPETLRIGGLISRALLKIPHVATVEQQAGRAEMGEDTWGTHKCEFHVELDTVSAKQEVQIADAIRDTLKSFPGISSEVVTFLGDRLSETIAGETSPIVVSIFGDDLDVLDVKAREVANVLTGAGAVDVIVKSPPGAPGLAIRLRPERLSQFGFRPLEVLEAIQTAFQGMVVAQTHRGTQTADVAVVLDAASRRDPESVGDLLLRSSQGNHVPLRELADIYPTSGRVSIMHEGARRRQTITCAPGSKDLSAFVEEARKQIAAKVVLPKNIYVAFTGAAQAKEKAQTELVLNSSMAGVGILLLLSAAFRRPRNLLLVLANVPFALVGGVTAMWLMKTYGESGAGGVSIGSLVGFVTLFGITTRNSIMLISHFEHLVNEEGMEWGPAVATRGASERLMPILMTATITGFGLLPLALGSGEAGREIEGPMAVVILGGLVTSTALNLLVLPTLALRYGRFQKQANEETGT